MNSFSHGAVLSILSVSLAEVLNLEPLQQAKTASQPSEVGQICYKLLVLVVVLM